LRTTNADRIIQANISESPPFRALLGWLSEMIGDDLSDGERLEIQLQLDRLREEHRDLDAAINALLHSGQADQLQVQRLKKRKLALRDRVQALEDDLTPDIIA
jgi:hypothetical protein